MRKLLTAALAAAGCLAPAAAQAQSADKYPEKQIRIIVPYPPGGSVDVLGRLLAQRMQENWGQPVIVENRPGAGNDDRHRGGREVAPPDGYTLIIVVSGHTTNPALYASMQYDGIKDFAPIALLARTPVVLYAHPSLPGEGREGAGRARQGRDPQAQLRLGRRRQHDAPHRRADQGR